MAKNTELILDLIAISDALFTDKLRLAKMAIKAMWYTGCPKDLHEIYSELLLLKSSDFQGIDALRRKVLNYVYSLEQAEKNTNQNGFEPALSN